MKIEKRRIIKLRPEEYEKNPYLVTSMTKDEINILIRIGENWKLKGKLYNITNLSDLIVGNRNFCLEHGKNIADDLRKHWRDEEKKKECHNGFTTLKLRYSI